MKQLTMASIAAVLVLGASACSGDGTTATPSTPGTPEEGGHAITVTDNLFTPADLTVAAGDTVTWTWTGTTQPHNVVAGDTTFSSGSVVADREPFSFTFTEAGSFPYTCQAHPAEMSGTITVE